MNHAEAAEALGLRNVREDDVNPLRVAINLEFNRKGVEPINGKDYRERAIDRCVSKRVGFTSEDNTLHNLVKRLLVVFCPSCNSDMIRETHAGGDSHSYTTTFRCPTHGCDCKVSLSLPYSAISVSYPEDTERERLSSEKRGVTYLGSH